MSNVVLQQVDTDPSVFTIPLAEKWGSKVNCKVVHVFENRCSSFVWWLWIIHFSLRCLIISTHAQGYWSPVYRSGSLVNIDLVQFPLGQAYSMPCLLSREVYMRAFLTSLVWSLPFHFGLLLVKALAANCVVVVPFVSLDFQLWWRNRLWKLSYKTL